MVRGVLKKRLMFSTQRAESIERLYVLGDSLSVVGMVFWTTGGMYPPHLTYFHGRHSDGLVGVEDLAERLHRSHGQSILLVQLLSWMVIAVWFTLIDFSA